MTWTRLILYQALIVLALLLGIEGALRIGYTVHKGLAQEAPWFVYAADVGWDRRPNFDGADDCGIERTFDSHGFVAAESGRLGEGGKGQLRVVFLGDSNTYGACRETEDTFVAVAARLVPQAHLMNLGVNGYTSYQGYKALLKYGKVVRPDLIFIAFNYNDRRFVLQPSLADSDELFRRLASSDTFRKLANVSYIAWAAGEAGKWFAGRGAEKGAPRMIGDMEAANVRLDKVRPRVDAKSYRENLSKMVRWAKENGSAVAFILMGDNPNQTDDLREGLQFYAQKNYDQAIAAFQATLEGEDVWFGALARLYLSRIYRETGRPQEAEKILIMENAVAGLTGGYPVVLDTEYQQIMREVASEHGIAVIDAASELSKTPEVYWDFCHFDDTGNEIVGRLVAGAIETVLSARMASEK